MTLRMVLQECVGLSPATVCKQYVRGNSVEVVLQQVLVAANKGHATFSRCSSNVM